MTDELRRCKDCGKEKSLSDFPKQQHSPRPYCKKCAAVRLRTWREKNVEHVKAYHQKYNQRPERKAKHRERSREAYHRDPDRARDNNLLREFGITLDEYNEMLAAQNYACAICQKPCKSGRQLAVDHDHATGRIRALLCMNCNRAIGWMDDDVDRLLAAANYLMSYRNVLGGIA